MSLTNPIQYTIFGQSVPYNRLPIIETSSDGMAFGTILMLLPLTSAAVTAKIWNLQAPTTSEDRWIRIPPDQYPLFPNALSYQTILQDDGYYKISWQFDPTVLVAVDGNFYSIEFFVNTADDASIPQGAPKLIVKIVDEIV